MTPAPADLPGATPRFVLLVDDSPAERELMAHYLAPWQECGRLASANDGADALDFLQCRGRHAGRDAKLPWLIVIDNNMPVMDGFEAVAAMRDIPGLHSSPIVMWSGSSDPADAARAYACGATSYLRKPTSSRQAEEVLQLVVRYWMELHRQA
jgi:CheY-like chemotaxis protein